MAHFFIPATLNSQPPMPQPLPEFDFDGLVREAKAEIERSLGSDWYAELDGDDRRIVDEAIRVTAAAASAAISIDWNDPAARELLASRRNHVMAQLANLGAARVQGIADAVSLAFSKVIQRGIVIALGSLV